MSIKAVFHFTDGRYGWSETYWDTDRTAAAATTQARALRLAALRGALLAGPTKDAGGNIIAGGAAAPRSFVNVHVIFPFSGDVSWLHLPRS